MAANPGPGFLCHACAKASGADPFKKPALPRKRKDPAERRKVTSFEETERVKSLAKMCIEVSGLGMGWMVSESVLDCISPLNFWMIPGEWWLVVRGLRLGSFFARSLASTSMMLRRSVILARSI